MIQKRKDVCVHILGAGQGKSKNLNGVHVRNDCLDECFHWGLDNGPTFSVLHQVLYRHRKLSQHVIAFTLPRLLLYNKEDLTDEWELDNDRDTDLKQRSRLVNEVVLVDYF